MVKEKEEKKKTEKAEAKKLVRTPGKVGTRGRTFEGIVAKKFPHRVVVEFQRTVKVPKYERFRMKKTRLHARVPEGMDLKEGDYVKVQECRPLSKILHFVVIKVTKKSEEAEK